MTSGWWAVIAVAMAWALWPVGARFERPFFTKVDDAAEGPLDVAYTMDLLALALAGGAPTVVALEAVAGVGAGEPLGAQHRDQHEMPLGAGAGSLARVAAALRWGVAESSAWATVSPVWRPVATAFELSARCGAAPSSLLRQAAEDLRRSESERVAVAAAKAGVRIVLPLGLCFLPAFVLIAIVPMVMGLVELPV